MTEREEALEEIARLAGAHGITASEIAAELTGEDAPKKKEERGRGLVSKALSYMGGLLVFAGIAVFTGTFWQEMNSAARIIITLGSGVVFYILGFMADSDSRFRKAVFPLFLLAALFETTGMFVAIDELFNNGSDARYAVIAVFSAMFVQQAATFAVKRYSSLLVYMVFFGISDFVVICNLLGVGWELTGIVAGASLAMISYGISKGKFMKLAPFGYFFGASWFSFSFFDITNGNILFLLLAAGTVYISTALKSRVLLVVGAISTLSYIFHFTSLYFVRSIGWPLSLVIMGFIMMGVAALGVRVDRRYIRG